MTAGLQWGQAKPRTDSFIVLRSFVQLNVCLQVVVSYSQQLQDGLIKEGLYVTRLTVSGPDPYPNETVADQIVQQLGEPSIWTRYR